MSRAREWLLVVTLVVLGGGLRLGLRHGWTFAGADSYGYVKLAMEWRAHGRYALGPGEPLHASRLPGYPLLIAAVGGWATDGRPSDQPGLDRITLAQAVLGALVLLPLVHLVARRLAGPRAALIALGLAAVWPFDVLYTAAALTEAPATVFTLAALAPLVLGAARPRLAAALAGAGVGASVLLRPDGILLGAALLPGLAVLAPGPVRGAPRARAALAAWFVLGFVLIYGPWPARNLARFGRPYLVGTRVDKATRPLLHYEGYWSWLKTWGADETNQARSATCFFNPPCPATLDAYPAHAFDSEEERRIVAALLAERSLTGLTPALSAGFERLAEARRARHPLRVRAFLPLSRAYHMWITGEHEVLQRPDRPLPPYTRLVEPILLPLTVALVLALLAGLSVLLRDPATRWPALILALPLALRSLLLPAALYSMPRYAVEVMPLALILAVAGIARATARGRC